jgi:hypothetical protein
MLQWANQIWLRLKALGKRNCRSGGGAAGCGVGDHAIETPIVTSTKPTAAKTLISRRPKRGPAYDCKLM